MGPGVTAFACPVSLDAGVTAFAYRVSLENVVLKISYDNKGRTPTQRPTYSESVLVWVQLASSKWPAGGRPGCRALLPPGGASAGIRSRAFPLPPPRSPWQGGRPGLGPLPAQTPRTARTAEAVCLHADLPRRGASRVPQVWAGGPRASASCSVAPARLPKASASRRGRRGAAGGVPGAGRRCAPLLPALVIHIKHWAPLFLRLCVRGALPARGRPAAALITALPAPARRAFEGVPLPRRPCTP